MAFANLDLPNLLIPPIGGCEYLLDFPLPIPNVDTFPEELVIGLIGFHGVILLFIMVEALYSEICIDALFPLLFPFAPLDEGFPFIPTCLPVPGSYLPNLDWSMRDISGCPDGI